MTASANSAEILNRPAADVAAAKAKLAASLHAAPRTETPYRHWDLSNIFGAETVAELNSLPFPAPDLGGVSGARELHNNTRRYFDADNIAAFPVCRTIAETFQDAETVAMIEQVTGAKLDGCYLRIEYAQDVDGFWLAPHTDLGVKKLTMLYYLGDEDQADLGTDIFVDADTWAKRSTFNADSALVFVPSNNTWHGFNPREIGGVRKSVIINYVTDEWRAREQLAYPTQPVGV